MGKLSSNKKSEQPTKTAPVPSIRRRGRPTGKNRVPLTIEQRRARNALYEQERRGDVANAFKELAASLYVDSDIGHAELLAKAAQYIKERSEKPVDAYRRQNAKLEWQIQKLTEDMAPFQDEDCEQGETEE